MPNYVHRVSYLTRPLQIVGADEALGRPFVVKNLVEHGEMT
jgi:hypothetical protein